MDLERRCGSAIFLHGLLERRNPYYEVRCGRVILGALRGNGRKSPCRSEIGPGAKCQSGLLPLSYPGNAHCHSAEVRTWQMQLVQGPRTGPEEGPWPVGPTAVGGLQICGGFWRTVDELGPRGSVLESNCPGASACSWKLADCEISVRRCYAGRLHVHPSPAPFSVR